MLVSSSSRLSPSIALTLRGLPAGCPNLFLFILLRFSAAVVSLVVLGCLGRDRFDGRQYGVPSSHLFYAHTFSSANVFPILLNQFKS